MKEPLKVKTNENRKLLSFSKLIAGTLICLFSTFAYSGGDPGGGHPKGLLRAADTSKDPLIEKEAADERQRQRNRDLYKKNEVRINLATEVKGWSELTHLFYAFLFYNHYPFNPDFESDILSKLTPYEIEKTFDIIFKGATEVQGNDFFTYSEEDLKINNDRVLFISDPQKGTLQVNLKEWNRTLNLKAAEILNGDIEKLPTIGIIATLFHEVLVLKNIEKSQDYTYSAQFANALKNIFLYDLDNEDPLNLKYPLKGICSKSKDSADDVQAQFVLLSLENNWRNSLGLYERQWTTNHRSSFDRYSKEGVIHDFKRGQYFRMNLDFDELRKILLKTRTRVKESNEDARTQGSNYNPCLN